MYSPQQIIDQTGILQLVAPYRYVHPLLLSFCRFSLRLPLRQSYDGTNRNLAHPWIDYLLKSLRIESAARGQVTSIHELPIRRTPANWVALPLQ
jgi:hypothetical protein